MRRNTQEKILLNAVVTAQKSAMENVGDFDEIIVFVSTGAGTTFPVLTVQGTLQGYEANNPNPVIPANVQSPTNRYVNLAFTDLNLGTIIAGDTGITLSANVTKALRIGVQGNHTSLEGMFVTLTGTFDCPTTVSWAGYTLA